MRSQKNESGRDCIDTGEGSKVEVSTVLITTKTWKVSNLSAPTEIGSPDVRSRVVVSLSSQLTLAEPTQLKPRSLRSIDTVNIYAQGLGCGLVVCSSSNHVWPWYRTLHICRGNIRLWAGIPNSTRQNWYPDIAESVSMPQRQRVPFWEMAAHQTDGLIEENDSGHMVESPAEPRIQYSQSFLAM
jgi:hypothetical protein